MKTFRVLLTGAGAPGAPGIISCYKNVENTKVQIIGVDVKPQVPTMPYLDSFYQISPANDKNFINEIIDICKKEQINIIQPLVTKELEIFAKNSELFKEMGVLVAVSDFENLEIANDKSKLLSFLKLNNVVVPDFTVVNDYKDFETACRSMGYPHRKVCFKPSQSNGSRGFRIIDSNIDKTRLLFEEKPTSTYITFEEIIEILSQNKFPELLVMEYLPGDEYSVDMLCNKGESIYVIPRIRQEMIGGISKKCEIRNNPEIITYCKEIAMKLKLHGNIGIQVKYDSNGIVKILEINPRLQGSVVACLGAGVNLPYYSLLLFNNLDIPKVNIKWNTVMDRHWKEVFFDDNGQSFTFNLF